MLRVAVNVEPLHSYVGPDEFISDSVLVCICGRDAPDRRIWRWGWEQAALWAHSHGLECQVVTTVVGQHKSLWVRMRFTLFGRHLASDFKGIGLDMPIITDICELSGPMIIV